MLIDWYFGSFWFLIVYWGCFIVKSIVKKCKPHLSVFTYTTNEWILQYTYFTSPIICLYKYCPNPGLGCIDFFGNVVLSLNSYYYHNEVYNHLTKTHAVNMFDKTNYKNYLNDILSIHIRSFCCVWVNLITVDIYGSFILSHLAIYHLISLYYFYQYLMEKKYDNERMIQMELKQGNETTMDLMVRAPIFVDILVTLYHNYDPVSRHHNLISLLMIVCVMLIKPLYELNHFALHICLLYQTYALSGCNKSVLTR